MRAHFSLHAISTDKKIFRYYHLLLAPDLLSGWLLTTYHGGIGKKGRLRHQICQDLVDIKHLLGVKLAKRFNAAKRIGCNYTLKQYRVDQEFEDKILNGKLKILIEENY
ncbi:MAG: hypothetical protein ABFQ95_05845 [Pseudomonadota bacterium]